MAESAKKRNGLEKQSKCQKMQASEQASEQEEERRMGRAGDGGG
jgi:hypothetical protein